jgi:hypothetical protein
MDNGLAHEGSAFINFRHYVPAPKEHVARLGLSGQLLNG